MSQLDPILEKNILILILLLVRKVKQCYQFDKGYIFHNKVSETIAIK